MKTAFKELGEREIAGRRSNPDIERFLQSTIVGPVVPVADEVPWCSALVNFCMEHNGLKGTGTRLARSWLTWVPEQEDDMTEEQARQLKAVFDGLTVPGTTSAEEAFNKLFERVRNIENMVEEISKRV